MLIKSETRFVQFSLTRWHGGWNAGYEPDCFADLDNGELAATNKAGYVGSEWVVFMRDKELDECVEWWHNECATVNRGEDGDCLMPLTKGEIDNGDGWVFGVEDAPKYLQEAYDEGDWDCVGWAE